MSDDLIDALRSGATSIRLKDGSIHYPSHLAADRIDALETALWIISHAKRDPCDKHCGFFLDLQQIAKDALMEGRDD